MLSIHEVASGQMVVIHISNTGMQKEQQARKGQGEKSHEENRQPKGRYQRALNRFKNSKYA